MVMRSSARLQSLICHSKDTNEFNPHISEGFENYEMRDSSIPDGYASLQAGHYHIKKTPTLLL